jgi:hypothetical protein
VGNEKYFQKDPKLKLKIRRQDKKTSRKTPFSAHAISPAKVHHPTENT